MDLSVTLILIIITVAVTWYAWQNADIMQKWIFHPYSIQHDNSWYRFVTSGFLHADYMHLFFNMFTMYAFGNYVEREFSARYGLEIGIVLYLLLYIGGIIVSDIPTYIKHRHDPPYRALGASGGVSSILFSSILFYPTSEIGLIFIPIGIPGFIFGILYLMYSYYQGKRMGDNINHDAHFYGAVYGFVISLVLVPQAFPNFIQQISSWRMFG